MSGFKVKLTGLDSIRNKLSAKEIEKEVNLELNAFGNDIVRGAKQKAPVDEGHLKNSISYKVSGTSLEIIVATNYAAYIEFGTRKFAAAEVAKLPAEWKDFAAQFKGKGGGDFYDFLNSILDWVIRKGIASRFSVKTKKKIPIKIGSGSTDEQRLEETAYAIALSILRNGIRAQPYLFPAYEEALIELKNRNK